MLTHLRFGLGEMYGCIRVLDYGAYEQIKQINARARQFEKVETMRLMKDDRKEHTTSFWVFFCLSSVIMTTPGRAADAKHDTFVSQSVPLL